MAQSLLFIPDISGFTEFVQSTEAAHSQHVIAELLEVLIQANQLELQLAEIEGDALFFYKENELPSQERLLAQIEHIFTAFYSHLKLLEKNRVCWSGSGMASSTSTAVNMYRNVPRRLAIIDDTAMPPKNGDDNAWVIPAKAVPPSGWF